MRSTLVLGLLLVAGLAGCLASSQQDTSTAPAPSPAAYVVPPVPKVDAAALLVDHAAFVAKNNERAQNKPTHESARVDLLKLFASYGLDTYRFNFTDGIPQADILGVKWGVDRDHWVFVGGHYDTITDDCLPQVLVGEEPTTCPLRGLSQGAYDDGSGTMMTVHLAKAFATITPYYTIAFTAYDGEERGIQGAAAIVEAIQTGNFTFRGVTPTIVGDLDLDMIGINWPGTMAPINLLDNTALGASKVLAKAKEMGFPEGQIVEKQGLKLGSSDYSAFWRIDTPAPVPTIFFISDFEEMGAPAPAPDPAHSPTAPGQSPAPLGAYPFWHLQDTVETMTAMAGGHDQLVAGFQAASDLAAYVVHFLACDPAHPITDAIAR